MLFLENSSKQSKEIRPDPGQCTIVTASYRYNTAGSDIYALDLNLIICERLYQRIFLNICV